MTALLLRANAVVTIENVRGMAPFCPSTDDERDQFFDALEDAEDQDKRGPGRC